MGSLLQLNQLIVIFLCILYSSSHLSTHSLRNACLPFPLHLPQNLPTSGPNQTLSHWLPLQSPETNCAKSVTLFFICFLCSAISSLKATGTRFSTTYYIQKHYLHKSTRRHLSMAYVSQSPEMSKGKQAQFYSKKSLTLLWIITHWYISQNSVERRFQAIICGTTLTWAKQAEALPWPV